MDSKELTQLGRDAFIGHCCQVNEEKVGDGKMFSSLTFAVSEKSSDTRPSVRKWSSGRTQNALDPGMVVKIHPGQQFLIVDLDYFRSETHFILLADSRTISVFLTYIEDEILTITPQLTKEQRLFLEKVSGRRQYGMHWPSV